MKTSISYLEDALERMGDEPDSHKAERLKMSKQALYNYRTGVSRMDNFACIMVGRYLGIDPMKIMAACEQERAKTPEKQEFWRDFRKTLGHQAMAGLALATAMMTAPNTADAAPLARADNLGNSVYYVKLCAKFHSHQHAQKPSPVNALVANQL